MSADGNPLPRVLPEAEAVAAPKGGKPVAWNHRPRPGPEGSRRRHPDPAAEAMSHNPNLSPPIHFSHED